MYCLHKMYQAGSTDKTHIKELEMENNILKDVVRELKQATPYGMPRYGADREDICMLGWQMQVSKRAFENAHASVIIGEARMASQRYFEFLVKELGKIRGPSKWSDEGDIIDEVLLHEDPYKHAVEMTSMSVMIGDMTGASMYSNMCKSLLRSESGMEKLLRDMED